MFLLICTGRTVGRRNVANGSKYVFLRKVGPFWDSMEFVNNFAYLLQNTENFLSP